MEETYAVDTLTGPALWVKDGAAAGERDARLVAEGETLPRPAHQEPPPPGDGAAEEGVVLPWLDKYWAAVAYFATGGVLAVVGRMLQSDLPTLLALWLLLGVLLCFLCTSWEMEQGR